jgi:hypothetical protein
MSDSFVHCNDSGENKAFQKECKSKALNIIFDFWDLGQLNVTAKLKGNSKTFIEGFKQLSFVPD